MEKNNFIIEVKTKWKQVDDKYTREVIEYTCPCEFEFVDASLYTRYLEASNTYQEESDMISSNNIEIKAITKDSKVEIQEPSVLVRTLLEFTKYQWLKGE